MPAQRKHRLCTPRKTPNASVDIGYPSVIAAHMANLAVRNNALYWRWGESVQPEFPAIGSELN